MSEVSVNTLVVGGEGAVGSLFCALARANFAGSVVSLDIKPNPAERVNGVEYREGNVVSEHAAELVASAEVIVLALPADVALQAVVELSPRLRAQQCLVDTLSVKLQYVTKLQQLQPAHEALSLNPLFAPALGFKDRSVASVVVRRGPLGSKLIDAMKAAGATIVAMSAEDHDRQTAAIQAATHAAVLAFAMTLDTIGYRPSDNPALWAPPHATLLALVARIVSGEPVVYRDIQVANPFADGARAALGSACAELSRFVNTNDPTVFAELVGRLTDMLGSERASLEARCRAIFEGMQTSPQKPSRSKRALQEQKESTD
jgi:prephenate dehydrogenase